MTVETSFILLHTVSTEKSGLSNVHSSTAFYSYKTRVDLLLFPYQIQSIMSTIVYIHTHFYIIHLLKKTYFKYFLQSGSIILHSR